MTKQYQFFVALHVLIITASNYLVQLPLELFHFVVDWGLLAEPLITTWGALSFPLIYLATDITVRLYNAQLARKIVFSAMLPAFLISYLVTVVFQQGSFHGFSGLSEFNSFGFRIAFASFAAYAIGQVVDIYVFAKLRNHSKWWVAPINSNIIGNAIDTLIFFSLAFYLSSDPFMAQHWPEIATIDYLFKLVFSLVFFIPVYRIIVAKLVSKLHH